MYKYLLKKFGLSDASPKVLTSANIIIVILTLVLGTAVFISLALDIASHRQTQPALMALLLLIYPALLFGIGLHAYLLLAVAYGIARVLAALPAMLRALLDGCVAIGHTFAALFRLIVGVPHALASVSGRDWLLMLYFAASFSFIAGVGIVLWPTAASLANSLLGSHDLGLILPVDMAISSSIFLGLLVAAALVWTVIRGLFMLIFKR